MINRVYAFEDGTISIRSAKEMDAQEQLRKLCELCPERGAITDAELVRLEERDNRAGTPGQSYIKLRPSHWQGVPELPVYASDIPSPKLDIAVAHDGRVQRGNVLGQFCGVPIVTLDEFNIEVDEERDLWNRIANSSGTSIPAEILPGEERCKDGIIRRQTTAEAQGYDTYHNQEQIEQGRNRSSVQDGKLAAEAGKLIYWRPNRATLEVYTVGTVLACLDKEPEPFVLIEEGD
jgi:hypothetical protein